jgi:hypothetical protein
MSSPLLDSGHLGVIPLKVVTAMNQNSQSLTFTGRISDKY